jgi:3-methyladenine DNA glycosylase AlkD
MTKNPQIKRKDVSKSLTQIRHEIRNEADVERAENLAWFFKTGKGEYAEGDRFFGLGQPKCRRIAKRYSELPDTEIRALALSKWHEERMIAFLILMARYATSDESGRRATFEFILKILKGVNNWDLVDVCMPKTIGWHLYAHPEERTRLERWAKSLSLWERRISIIATSYFVNQGRFTETLNIAELLLADRHDLIHKAVGWMLREIGKRDIKTAERFLKARYKTMPRTMLRYAIERFPEKKRKAYLRGER